MNLKEQLANLQKAMAQIVANAKAAQREITKDELADLEAKAAEAADLKERIDRAERGDNLLKQFQLPNDEGTGSGDDDADEAQKAATLGEFAVKSGLFDRWKAGSGKRDASSGLEFLKAPTDPLLVGANGQTQYGGVVPTRLRRLTIADLLAPGRMNATSLTYWAQGASEGAPAAVAEGAKKPSVKFAFGPVTEALSKLAAITKVSDESMEDTPYLTSVVNSQLVARLQIVEEDQILNGSGTAPNLRGILNRSGILTQGAVGDSASGNLDSIHKALTKVANGASLMPADGIVINPTDYENLRLMKDANEQYYGGGPFTGAYGNGGLVENPAIWGLRTVVTPAIAAGTALVGSFALGGQLFRKGGIRVDSTNSNVDDFENNLVTLRAEERVLLAIYYASAFCRVTFGAA